MAYIDVWGYDREFFCSVMQLLTVMFAYTALHDADNVGEFAVGEGSEWTEGSAGRPEGEQHPRV